MFDWLEFQHFSGITATNLFIHLLTDFSLIKQGIQIKAQRIDEAAADNVGAILDYWDWSFLYLSIVTDTAAKTNGNLRADTLLNDFVQTLKSATQKNGETADANVPDLFLKINSQRRCWTFAG